MKGIFFSFVAGLLLIHPTMGFAATTGDPSEVNITVYEVRLAPGNDCTNGVTIFQSASGSTQNMLNSPTFGSGAIPNGTYNCFMVKMSDRITGKSGFTSDNNFCVQGATIVLDVARPNSGDTPKDPDGNTITVTNGNDIVWAFFKVTPSGSGTECLNRDSGCQLSAPIVVTGDRALTFVTDFRGKVEENFGQCDIQAPVMSAR